ncbi:MAG: Uma2 family endonuclease [Microcystaceae cyanobacterium]
MVATLTKSPNRVLLDHISWTTYQALIRESGEQGNKRFTYDQGQLEIMTPLPEHEIYKKIIDRFIVIIVEEMNLEMRSLGSCTWSRMDLKQGLEPDECYYINQEEAVRGKMEIDLSCDPPPDLAIEIDITSSSLNRMVIYAALGVSEIWRFDGQTLIIYQLEQGEYKDGQTSRIFPFLKSEDVMRFLQRTEESEMALIKTFRRWVISVTSDQ